MKKLLRGFLTALLVLALCAPAWANKTSETKQPCLSKNDTHYGQYHRGHKKVDKHKLKVLKQFRLLKAAYNRSMEDSRQMFLEFIGSSATPADCDVQAVRDEYEQQITQLNATITSLQDQIAQLNATITSNEQQIAQLNATITANEQQIAQLNATIASDAQQISQLSASNETCQAQVSLLNADISAQLQQIADLDQTIGIQQQQIDTMTTTHQQELDDQASALEQQCQGRETTAYNNGYTEGSATCASTGPAGDPQLQTSWSTAADGYNPHALDVNASGITYVLDQSQKTVAGYNSTGAQVGNWTSSALVLPVDLAVDSSGNIFILDQYAGTPVMKFTASGQQQAFDTSSTYISYPLGMTIDNQDNVYVTDMGGAYGGRILKFSPSGALLATFDDVSENGIAGDFYSDVAVDETSQSVYIVTLYNHMVAKFNADGTYAGSWQADSANPNSIAVGAQGQVFVADTGNYQVDQYDASGNLTFTIQDPPLFRPSRIVVDNTGKLCVAGGSYQLVLIYQ